jgi:hypothetical protein
LRRHAADRFGKNAGGRGFADTTRACKEISVCKAPLSNGVLEGVRDVFLADEISKVLRAIASGKDDVRHALSSNLDSLKKVGPDGSCQKPWSGTVAPFRAWRGSRSEARRGQAPPRV